MKGSLFRCASWQRSSVAEAGRRVCQVPDTSREKEKYVALCRLLDRTAHRKLQRLLPVSAHCDEKYEQAMMKQLRTVFVALLLVPSLFSNANAFTTDSALNVGRPPAGICWIYWGGTWYPFPC